MEVVKSYRSIKDNKQLRIQAMAMFMSGKFYPTEIADRLSIDINELGYYVFGADKTGTSKSCWHHMKESGEQPHFLAVYEEIKTLYIKKTEKKLLDAVNEAVDNLVSSGKIEDADSKDLVNLVSAMEKIDKIGRLEEGRATSHTVNETKSFSLRDIEAQSDSITDLPYTEIKKDPEIKKDIINNNG